MGAIASRQRARRVEEVDIVSNHAYKYPPRSGNYFGSHFIMGGERFDTPQPESYLFGENSDLNFLSSRPTPFPYPPPQPNEPTKTLKSLVNIRKESLRFVRVPTDGGKSRLETGSGDSQEKDVEVGKSSSFNIEFIFDSDVRCAITIYYFCTEEMTPTGVTYNSRDPSLNSETFHYKKGANQQFCQISHVFDPTPFCDYDLLYDMEREVIPIAIHCVADEGPEEMRQSHTTIAICETTSDGMYVLKALKQKLFVDGLCYLLQEIYGIENKNYEKQASDDDMEDSGAECVICMCDVRDTLILPCRHLCLCNSCADSLRYQANNCPICRAPFRALLQIRALQRTSSAIQPVSPPEGSCDNIPPIPPGYEAVSLIEALNGPMLPRQPPAAVADLVETPDNENAVQAAQLLNRPSEEHVSTKPAKELDVSRHEFGMRIIPLAKREEEGREPQKCPLLSSEAESSSRSDKHRSRESLRCPDTFEKDETQDEDSEAEKLSPLLQDDLSCRGNPLALNMDDIVEHIDDADSDHEESASYSKGGKSRKSVRLGEEKERGEESDYYTPEESAPGHSVALYEGEPSSSSIEGTPQKVPITPLSHVSGSTDSYSSGSSTHRLLVADSSAAPSDRTLNV